MTFQVNESKTYQGGNYSAKAVSYITKLGDTVNSVIYRYNGSQDELWDTVMEIYNIPRCYSSFESAKRAAQRIAKNW